MLDKELEEGWEVSVANVFKTAMRTDEERATALNKIIQLSEIPTNMISDGYHTFGELYEHRITNFIALCRMIDATYPNVMLVSQIEPDTIKRVDIGNPIWRSLKHSDGELAFGGTWFVLGINKEAGKQITYHLPIDKWDDCSFANDLEIAPEWDSHMSSDVLERLAKL